MKKTKTLAQKYNAYEYALYLLSFSMRSERALLKRLLIKKYPKQDVTSAMVKLKRYDFINDAQTALLLVKSRLNAGKGTYAIRAELLQKGFSIDIINNCIESAEKEFPSESERAIRSAKKKAAKWKGLSNQKKYQRMFSYLQRKGFSYEATRYVLKNLFNKETEENN